MRTAQLPTLVLLSLALGSACSSKVPSVTGMVAAPPASCLPGERGYLRVGLRGAMERDLDWSGALLQCEGGARPEGRGLRVSFSSVAPGAGTKLRIVFGIAAAPGANRSVNLPTNITVIVEGGNRLYATQGDDKCQVESLVQQPLEGAPGEHAYRIAARGYCIDPATTLDGSRRLYINRFDFAGVARFEALDLHASTAGPG